MCFTEAGGAKIIASTMSSIMHCDQTKAQMLSPQSHMWKTKCLVYTWKVEAVRRVSVGCLARHIVLRCRHINLQPAESTHSPALSFVVLANQRLGSQCNSWILVIVWISVGSKIILEHNYNNNNNNNNNSTRTLQGVKHGVRQRTQYCNPWRD